ncbi:MAG: hypothetical protein JO307_27945 [Bryobacterales bacterium]|nr:hypothetical protein [Bryobacterales bacterium]
MTALVAFAQPPIAPTDEPTQPNRGDNVSNYNVLQSFELGYRWRTVGGDEDMYRATVNYGNGVRLLSSSLSVQSRDGHGKWFDQILLNTLGLGNDPYQSAVLRVEKNGLYRYDFTWRSNAYFNPALPISFGQHGMNTTRHLQDQDLTLFPQSNIRFLLGYSRNTQSGPALSTIQLFDGSGDEFPLFSNIRIQQNEYRLGTDAQLFGFRLNAMYSWVDFKQDTSTTLIAPSQGNNVTDLTSLSSFNRAEPYHGTSPYWRVALFREGKKYWSMNGRFTYVAGRRGFVLDENSFGTDRIGANTLRQVITFGNAQRPAATGNLTFSIFPTSKITFTNQTSLYNIRMSGDSYFEQYTNGSPIVPIYVFNFLGIQTIANTSDVQYRASRWFLVHAGYNYSDRRINSIAAANLAAPVPPQSPIGQTNRLNAGLLGFTIKPARALTINLDGEIGRNSKPIYPISEKDYHTLGARLNYRYKAFRAVALARSLYNTNSVTLTTFASHTRQYSLDGSWTPKDWFAIDVAWSKLHLDSLGGISFFVNQQLVTGAQSYYVSNIQYATMNAHFSVRKRADVLVGFSYIQDFGDGRSNPLISPVTAPGLPPAFLAAQTFPLRFLSPQARLSIPIQPRIRWNVGYQYYGYREDFSTLQNFRANTGYTSISWSF